MAMDTFAVGGHEDLIMPEVETRSWKLEDGTRISYKYIGNPRTNACILLIHGFSGSSDYFCRNLVPLSEHSVVVACDLRGHGKSDKTRHGYHVNRLAADIKELIHALQVTGILKNGMDLIGVGCSIGAAVLWSYCELFTSQDFTKFVFVDQAPLQNYTANGDWGPAQGNYGCHDAASAAWTQANLILDFNFANRGLVASCLGYRFQPLSSDAITAKQSQDDERFFVSIAEQCDPKWLAKLMGDHTQYDHRDTLRNCVNRETLVIAGKRSGCFPVEGCFETVKLINEKDPPLASAIDFGSGHWLFYEEADRFNDVIKQFTYRDEYLH